MAPSSQHWEPPGNPGRFNLVVKDNVGPSSAGGLFVLSVGKLNVVGSTFINNVGASYYSDQIYVYGGTATFTNTAVMGSSPGPMLAKAPNGVTITTTNCFVKGQTLSGSGNLAGTLDPKLRPDGHIRWDSPLRNAGASVAQSRIDMDGEARPGSAPDIGSDQFVDSDGDQLADKWEVERTGNLTTLTSLAQDADGDGLTNEHEYVNDTYPTVIDTDGDGLSDGQEVSTQGTNPLSADSDGDDMPDGWEVTNGLSPLLANGFEDADGDGYPNVFDVCIFDQSGSLGVEANADLRCEWWWRRNAYNRERSR
jgi:hypothetical protein